jgi:Siphovirus Gp157
MKRCQVATPLMIEASNHQRLRDLLLSEFPDVDDQTLQDTLEGLSDLPDMLAVVLRSQLEDLMSAKALRGRIAEMETRLARFERRAQTKRQLVTAVMECAQLPKIVEPDFTASLRRTPPGLVVLDEGRIPGTFWKPQPAKLDRRAVLAALKAGQEINGAALDNGSITLAVRTT